MNQVRKVEVDIIKVAKQMGLNTERMLAYVFQGQPQQLDESSIQDNAVLEPLGQSARASFREPADLILLESNDR